jgi:hypothetical protein
MPDKKKVSEKQFLLIVGVPVAAIMVVILYFMLFKKTDKTSNSKDNNSKSSALVLPDVKGDSTKTKESKSSIYDDLSDEEKKKNAQENLKSSKDFFDMNEKSIKKNDDNQQRTSSIPTGSGSGNNVSYTNNNSSGKKYNSATTQYYQSTTPTQTISSNTVQQTNNDNSDNGYGFGVYKNSSATVKSNDVAVQQNDYIPAILENSQKIKNGSEVIFLLQADSYISGQQYEKMSIMYGIATFSGGRVDITINTIQDKTGQKHPVSLVGYNENYQKGVYYSDNDATMKQGKSNVVTSSAGKISNLATGGTIINGVVQTAQNALNNSKAEVDVSQGYKMYFK